MAANVGKLIQGDFAAAEGAMHLHTGRFRQAAEALETARKIRTQTGMKTQDIEWDHLRGLAYEGAGDLGQAVAAFQTSIGAAEGVRNSYSVAERTAFFRSTVRHPYHGLIRVSARQAAAEGSLAKFWEAVQASELVRARQLGDAIDPKAPPMMSVDALEVLRGTLGANRVVIYYTATERDLVILGFTRDRYLAVLQSLESVSFVESISQIARDLASPQSSLDRLEARLVALSRNVLAPVAELLWDKTELVVLPDGVLNLIPYDLLSADTQAYRPLVQTHRVHLLPSLRFAGRRLGPSAPAKPGRLFAVADPVYKKDVSVAGLGKEELAAATRGSRFLEYFAPLPETRSEAKAIARMFQAEGTQVLLGAQARESAVKRANLAVYSYLHFATHGILGGEVPGIGEPALVLADEPGEDGFLTASEVSALKFDARLAVLSACNTGSGEYVTGEGVMGLSRAFLLAGSRAVVMSLWPVASQATGRLMVRFYSNLRAGQDVQDALRSAKLALRDEARRGEHDRAAPVLLGALRRVWVLN